jgi:hypothetical protein
LLISEDPEVRGIAGVLQAYNNAIQRWTLSGPTLFSEIIDTCLTQNCMEPQTDQEQNYTILMIITDGVLNDVLFFHIFKRNCTSEFKSMPLTCSRRCKIIFSFLSQTIFLFL